MRDLKGTAEVLDLPVDTIKIDGVFVRRIDDVPGYQHLKTAGCCTGPDQHKPCQVIAYTAAP